MIENIQKKQAGATLVLALLTMAAVIAVAVAISVLILNEIITTRGITYSIKSFYSAESATEQALWIVRDVQLGGGTIEEATTAIDAMDGHLEDERVAWDRTATNRSESITVNLIQDESVFINVENPVEGGEDPYSFRIESCPMVANVEATWSGWNPASGFSDITYKQYPVACDTDYTIWKEIGQTIFRFQLRAFDAPVENKELIVETEGDVPIEIPSEIQIISTGEYPDGNALSAAQAIQVNFPWLLPVSGVYSYVLFSDSELNKD